MTTKQEFIQALRSGHYAQGYNRLATISIDTTWLICYCALGVLCDLRNPNAWAKISQHKLAWNKQAFVPQLDEDTEWLSHSSGVEDDEGDEMSVMSYIMHMNDEERKSFAEIADWLETRLD